MFNYFYRNIKTYLLIFSFYNPPYDKKRRCYKENSKNDSLGRKKCILLANLAPKKC